MHRADEQDTLDLIRALMSMNVTLVLVGVDILGSGLLREAHRDPKTRQWVMPPNLAPRINGMEATQTERRFDIVELDRFRYTTPDQITAFHDQLVSIQDSLRLFKAEPDVLTGGTMPEYLMRRTDGVVGLLERLMEDGCQEAMDSGKETLDEDLLDEIIISSTPRTATRRPGKSSRSPAPPGRGRPRPGRRAATPCSTTTAPPPHNADPHAPAACASSPGLTPLPGEGLAGLILRLAHRLDLTPAMLFARTGLMVPGFTYVSGRFLLGLEERLTTFAHVTRLTPVEAISLTLAPHAGNYPPIGGSVHIRRRR